MGFCDFGPPGNVVRMAVAACLWPTTFKIPSVFVNETCMHFATEDLLRNSCFDAAVATGNPTVISFSTPAYCQSATCGPQTEVLSKLDDKYKGLANFIHVEIFDNPEEMLAAGDPSLGIESPVIHEWEFHTEPWTFVVDVNGIVVGRFEAFVTLEEIEEYLLPVLTGA